jgi:hypothetical protein
MTTPLFKKMNLKDQKEVLVLNSPSSFDKELKALKGVKVLKSAAGVREISFAIAFVIKEAELNNAVRTLSRLAKGDAVVWFAYPKGVVEALQIRSQPRRQLGHRRQGRL